METESLEHPAVNMATLPRQEAHLPFPHPAKDMFYKKGLQTSSTTALGTRASQS